MNYMEKKSKLRKLRAKEWRELNDNHSPWSIWKKKVKTTKSEVSLIRQALLISLLLNPTRVESWRLVTFEYNEELCMWYMACRLVIFHSSEQDLSI